MSQATALKHTNTKPRPYLLVLCTLIVIEAAGIFEQTMVLGAVPFFAKHFETDIVQVSWIITVFVLVGAASAVIAGRLGDAYGRRRVLIVLLCVSVVGSLISVSFASLPALLVARALQGTSAGIIALLIGLCRETLAGKNVPVAIAIITATASFTAGVGVYVGGLFIDAGAWRMMFLAAAGLAVLALVMTVVVFPKTGVSTADREIDWFGAILIAPALMLVLYGVSSASSLGWGNAAAWGTITVGLALIAVWTWWELRVKRPIIDLRFLAKPQVARAMLSAILSGLGALALPPVALAVYMQSPAGLEVGLGQSASSYGLIFFFGSLLGFVLSPIIGRIIRRFGSSCVLIIGALLEVLPAIALMMPALREQPVVGIAATISICVGIMCLLAAVYNLVVDVVPSEATSEFVGVAQVVRNIAIAIGTVVTSSVLASSVVEGTKSPTATAWNTLMIYFIIVTAALVVLAMFTMRDRPRPTPGAEDDRPNDYEEPTEMGTVSALDSEDAIPATGGPRA